MSPGFGAGFVDSTAGSVSLSVFTLAERLWLSMTEIAPELALLQSGVLWQAYAKLVWAEEHFRAARNTLDKYTSESTGIRERFDSDAQQHVLELFAGKIPIRLPLMVGTGIHSLRSSLDTAVSVLIREAGGRADARINFPIHGTERELRASFESGERTCPDCKATRQSKPPANSIIRKRLPDLERMLLEIFQPWEGGNYALWALSKLDNLQKHQTLLLVFGIASGTINFETAGNNRADNNRWIIGADQTVAIARHPEPFRLTSGPHVELSLKFPGDIPFGGKAVFEVLEQFSKLVRGILITLQAHFEGGKSAFAATANTSAIS